jgi:hypothetical protein
LEDLDNGDLTDTPDVILGDSLSPEVRDHLGSIDPFFSGGEFLPDYERGEVEIARLALDSSTQDVISIRASPGQGQPIQYRIVDEHESKWEIQPQSSEVPLTLAELIAGIEGAGNSEWGWLGLEDIQCTYNDGCTIEEAATFIEFSSEFYDDLEKHYWLAIEKWKLEIIDSEGGAGE